MTQVGQPSEVLRSSDVDRANLPVISDRQHSTATQPGKLGIDLGMVNRQNNIYYSYSTPPDILFLL